MADPRTRMRDELLVAHARHHRRRRARRNAVRSGGTLVAVALVALLALRIRPVPPTPAPPTDVARTPDAPHQPAPSITRPRIEIVHSAPDTLERYAPRGATTYIEIVDDTALLNALRDFGHPTGLIRRGGRVHLTADIPLADPTAAPPVPDVS